jgi:hypothetical protein
MSVLNSKVLVLNRSYLPVHITSVRRALSLLYQDVAHAVDTEYRTFDFASWSALSPVDEAIGLVNAAIRVPRVILLRSYDRMPRRHVRFSRYNVFLRDQNKCQYCARPAAAVRAEPRPRRPALARRRVGVGERGLLVSPLQSREGRSHARRGEHATPARAVPAAVDAVHGRGLSAAPARRLDAVPERHGARGVRSQSDQ